MEVKSIAQKILDRISEEADKNIHQPAIGRSDLTFDGVTKSIWVLRNRIDRRWHTAQDFVGNVNTVTTREAKDYLVGEPITYRDSKMGALFLQGLGEYKYDNPTTKSINQVSIGSISKFTPNKLKKDALDGEIITDNFEVSFDSLKDKIGKLLNLENLEGKIKLELKKVEVEIEESITEKQVELERQAEKLRTELETTSKEIIALRDVITTFFKSEVELRARPFLDEYQDAIKRINPLNGTLVIDGGPGTGKTTSLIQRITFLISPTIKEYVPNLNEVDQHLLEGESNWVFFSPSELLKLYLVKAMQDENLNPNRRVFVWSHHRKTLVRQFELIKAGEKLPFRAGAIESPLLIKNTDSIKWVTENLVQFIISVQKQRTEKAAEINPSKYLWKDLGIRIVVNLRDTNKLNNIGQWIKFYQSMKEQFGSDIMQIQKDYSDLIEKEVSRLQVRCEAFPDFLEWARNNFNEDSLDNEDNEDDEEPDEDVEMEDNAEESTLVSNEMAFKLRFNKKLRALYRTNCLKEFDRNARFSKKNKLFFDEVIKYVEIVPNTAIGEKALFLKYFNFLKGGAELNLLNKIPSNYKAWRKNSLLQSAYLTEVGKDWLADDLKKKDNRLHADEMDLVLLTIFNFCKEIYDNNKALFNTSSNKYLVTYRVSAKGVVAVDEATDFSLLELLCMNALSHPRFNCFSLSGDIMQRMEQEGLKSWEDLKSLIPSVAIKSMEISYRQTPELLEIAKKLYEVSTGKKANYRSYSKGNANHPAPLLSKQDTLEKRIAWSAERVYEIYKVFPTNFAPNIAIFVANEEDVALVTDLLNKHEIFVDNQIKARACFKGEVLGESNQVRVFNIKYIKGLEFNSVLFLDIDKLEHLYPELVDKYLYVGLSRATFHLGMTTGLIIPKVLKPIEDMFVDGNWK